MPAGRGAATDDLFRAISDPTRRSMLDILSERPSTAGTVGHAFPRISQPAVSKHLKVLREAGLVDVQVRGSERVYRLRPGQLRELDRWVSRYRPFWEERLEALSSHLERADVVRRKRAYGSRR